MINQENLIEPYLLFSFNDYAMMRANDDISYFKNLIPEHKEIVELSNIYMLCKKPRISFIENSILFDDNELTIGFEFLSKKIIKREIGVIKNYKKYFPDAISFSINRDRTSKLVIKYPNGTINCPIEELFNLFDSICSFDSISDSELDYEVLYVGQSIGIKYNSNAFKRTINHTTIQRILSDLNENDPYSEIFILMFNVAQPYFIASSTLKPIDTKSASNFCNVISSSISDKFSIEEIVDISEYFLIKYFHPQYNKKLKATAPNKRAKLFKKLNKYDINSIYFIIDTSIKSINLFSESIKTNSVHRSKIQIHSDDERESFLDAIILWNFTKSDSSDDSTCKI